MGTDFLNDILMRPHTIWADKTSFIEPICLRVASIMKHKLTIIQRPSGFGVTTFVSTCSSMYDPYREDACHDLLGRSLHLTLPFHQGRPCVVLHLDLLGAFLSAGSNPTPRDLRRALNDYLNARFRYFLAQNSYLLSIPPGGVHDYIREGRVRTTFHMTVVSNRLFITSCHLTCANRNLS